MSDDKDEAGSSGGSKRFGEFSTMDDFSKVKYNCHADFSITIVNFILKILYFRTV